MAAQSQGADGYCYRYAQPRHFIFQSDFTAMGTRNRRRQAQPKTVTRRRPARFATVEAADQGRSFLVGNARTIVRYLNQGETGRLP